MDWVKGMLPDSMKEKEEHIEIKIPTPEPPSDFQLNEEDTRGLIVRPIKADEFAGEARGLLMEGQELQEGLVVVMQKPIVEPVGTPPPPQGPGHHKNYQANLFEKIVLCNPNTSSAQVGIQMRFQPDRSDALIWNYATNSGHSGILVRSVGPFDIMAQWMSRPFGMGTALYANMDYRTDSSISSVTHVRDQMWTLAHVHALWKGMYGMAKMDYNIGTKETRFTQGVKWQSVSRDLAFTGEVEDTGSFKLTCFKQLTGISDTSVSAVYDCNHQGTSSLWVGFGRQYLNHLSVKLAVNTMMQLKACIEGPIGRVMKYTYSCTYDPHEKNFKQGIQLEM